MLNISWLCPYCRSEHIKKMFDYPWLCYSCNKSFFRPTYEIEDLDELITNPEQGREIKPEEVGNWLRSLSEQALNEGM